MDEVVTEHRTTDIVDHTEQVMTEFVAELSHLPAVVAKLLADHTPDAGGRCRTCHIADGSGRVWSPCRLLRFAEAARALSPMAIIEPPSARRGHSRRSAVRSPHAPNTASAR